MQAQSVEYDDKVCLPSYIVLLAASSILAVAQLSRRVQLLVREGPEMSAFKIETLDVIVVAIQPCIPWDELHL